MTFDEAVSDVAPDDREAILKINREVARYTGHR
jgi:hypothetical protein